MADGEGRFPPRRGAKTHFHLRAGRGREGPRFHSATLPSDPSLLT